LYAACSEEERVEAETDELIFLSTLKINVCAKQSSRGLPLVGREERTGKERRRGEREEEGREEERVEVCS
jgi:hypothetical protein